MLLGIVSSILVAVTPLISQGEAFSHYDSSDFPSFLSMDITSDDSLHRFVGPNDPLSDSRYVPQDLIALANTDSLSLSRVEMYLHKDAAAALYAMADELYTVTRQPLTVVSAYRSYYNQLRINRTYGADEYRAKAGHSEHQLGLAVDLMGLNNTSIQQDPTMAQKYERLRDNAHRYGYTQSYQHGAHIDGYHEEKRHRRFVGVGVATSLYEQGLTYTQYVKSIPGLHEHND